MISPILLHFEAQKQFTFAASIGVELFGSGILLSS